MAHVSFPCFAINGFPSPPRTPDSPISEFELVEGGEDLELSDDFHLGLGAIPGGPVFAANTPESIFDEDYGPQIVSLINNAHKGVFDQHHQEPLSNTQTDMKAMVEELVDSDKKSKFSGIMPIQTRKSWLRSFGFETKFLNTTQLDSAMENFWDVIRKTYQDHLDYFINGKDRKLLGNRKFVEVIQFVRKDTLRVPLYVISKDGKKDTMMMTLVSSEIPPPTRAIVAIDIGIQKCLEKLVCSATFTNEKTTLTSAHVRFPNELGIHHSVQIAWPMGVRSYRGFGTTDTILYADFESGIADKIATAAYLSFKKITKHYFRSFYSPNSPLQRFWAENSTEQLDNIILSFLL